MYRMELKWEQRYTQRYTEQYNTPVVYVLNQCDHDKANYEKSLESLKERFGSKVAQIQFPVNAGPTFDTIIDVLQMKMYKYPERRWQTNHSGYP